MKHINKLVIPPASAVDVVIFTIDGGKLKVLLTKREHSPFKGAYALPGGFFGGNEVAGRAAVRVLREKGGVTRVYLEQLYTFDRVGRDPRGHVITVAYFSLVDKHTFTMGNRRGATGAALFDVKKMPPLPFDHANIVAHALTRLRNKIQYTNIVWSILPKEFTLSEIQGVYEAIWGRKVDKRNFRKKLLSLGLLRSLGRSTAGLKQRPAGLYAFKTRNPVELKRFF